MLFYVDISSAAAAQGGIHVISPTPTGANLNNINGGFEYDPISHHLVFWYGGNTVYDYNPDTNGVTPITFAGGPPAGAQEISGNTFGRFKYFNCGGGDCFAVNNGGSIDEFVLRLSTGTPDTMPPSDPASLTATAISSSQINLAWTASTDNVAVGGYNVFRCAGPGCAPTGFVQVASVATNSFGDSGLSASTFYSYAVKAFDLAGNLSGNSNTATAQTQPPDTIPPTAPSSLTAAAQSSAQINLSWAASTDATGVTRYRIERCAGVSCNTFTEIAQVNGAPPVTTYPDNGLSPLTPYSYRVRANDIAGNLSPYSNTATDTTQAAPATITLVDWGSSGGNGTPESGNTFGLAGWNTEFHGVFTGLAPCPGCGNGGGSTNVGTSNGDYNFQGVMTSTTPRTFAQGEVLSVLWYNNSNASITFTPRISFTCTTRPLDCGGAAPYYLMSTLTIAANSFGTTTYTVDGSTNNGCPVGGCTMVNTQVVFDNTGVLIADKLILQPLGSGDVIPPTNPSSLTATSITQSQINLSWTGSTDAGGVTAYLVERCSGGGCSNFAQVATVNGAPPATTFSDTGLATSTSYSYRVRASDAAANLSGYSNQATATTMTNADSMPPSTPTNLAVQIISYRQANLSWTASTDNVLVTGYTLENCPGVGCVNFTADQVISGTPPVTVASGFNYATGVTYSWRLKATDAAGNFSGYSNVVTATMLNPGPLQVGHDKAYLTLAAAVTASNNGDMIEVDFDVPGANVTQDITKCITIRGVGPPGTKAKFTWDGGTYQSGTGSNPIPNDVGIFHIKPTTCAPQQHIVLDNLEFSGAYVVDSNGAGVRVDSGFNVDFLNDYFHDNENGILTGNVPTLSDGSASTILIEHTTFARNGNNNAHNVYVGTMGHLIFRYNKSVDSREGHLLKSRAYISEIYSNFLSTKNPTFDGSLELDLPAGGTNFVIGNVIEQGTNTSNGAVLKQGEEPPFKLGPTNVWNPTNQLYFLNNTVFNYRGSGTFLDVTSTGNDFNNVAPPPLTFVNQNNILANGGTLYPTSMPTLASNNNTVATSADFLNSNGGSYALVAGASEIDAGTSIGVPTVPGFNLVPQTVYVDPASSAPRTTMGLDIDIGAYEFTAVTDATAPIAGNAGTLTTSVVGSSTLTISWTRGSDVDNLQSTLQYEVCASTSNNVTSVANCEANGTIVKPFTTNIESAAITGLAANTAYFFNVVVADLAGNKTAYVPVTATMRPLGHAGKIRARGGR